MGGVVVEYRHTLYATALVMTGTVGGALALAIMGKDSAVLVAVGGSFVSALLNLLNAKQNDDVRKKVEEVKAEVNGRTSELIAKIPDPPPVVENNADGSPPTPWQQGQAAGQFEAGKRAGARPRLCPFPGCVKSEGGHFH